jgi:hypothetical protein
MIREAVQADAKSIIAHIQRLTKESSIGIPLAPEEFNSTLEEEQKTLSEYAVSDNSIFLVAEVDGQIIGVLECKGRNGPSALSLSVAKSH